MAANTQKPRLGVWKFASCDGCQLTMLDCEDELLAIADAIDIAYFPEATRGQVDGTYDLSLVEGSITTPHDAERIHDVRRRSKRLVTIGACATAGGIQALRNFADVQDYMTQPWPYPSSLMIGCSARALNEDVVVDHSELEDARWFTREEAALMLKRTHPDGLAGPHPFAIAHHLLGRWVHDKS